MTQEGWQRRANLGLLYEREIPVVNVEFIRRAKKDTNILWSYSITKPGMVIQEFSAPRDRVAVQLGKRLMPDLKDKKFVAGQPQKERIITLGLWQEYDSSKGGGIVRRHTEPSDPGNLIEERYYLASGDLTVDLEDLSPPYDTNVVTYHGPIEPEKLSEYRFSWVQLEGENEPWLLVEPSNPQQREGEEDYCFIPPTAIIPPGMVHSTYARGDCTFLAIKSREIEK